MQGEKERQWADCMKHKNLEGRGGLTAPWLLPRPLQVATKDTRRMSTACAKALGLVHRRREDDHRDGGSGGQLRSPHQNTTAATNKCQKSMHVFTENYKVFKRMKRDLARDPVL